MLELAQELKTEQSLLVFGRGYNYATALEAALKVRHSCLSVLARGTYLLLAGLLCSQLAHSCPDQSSSSQGGTLTSCQSQCGLQDK
jgi:hypothetical protein